nr:hypothetical protein [Tanacetum cinerariifolium]
MTLKKFEKENEDENETKTNRSKVMRRNSYKLRKKKQQRHPSRRLYGIADDVLVDVAGYVYPVDFVIQDIKEDEKRPFMLGTPFLITAKAVIKVDKGTVTLRSGKSEMSFHRMPESLCALSSYLFTLPVSVRRNTRNIIASPVTPKVLNKLAISSILPTCSYASLFSFLEKSRAKYFSIVNVLISTSPISLVQRLTVQIRRKNKCYGPKWVWYPSWLGIAFQDLQKG